MARQSKNVRRRSLVAVVFPVFLAATAIVLTGSSMAGARSTSVRVLQMNLCDSGIAECYTGRSVAEAASVIRADAPDVVTLNEVCRADVSALDRALAAIDSPGTVVWAFQAALDRRTGTAFRCTDGQPYGIGLLVHLPAPDLGYVTYHGIYPPQDPGDPEERAWLCLDATGSFDACTTHLDNTFPTVALAQCRYLLRTVIPSVRARSGVAEPLVLGGDLNLHSSGSPDVRTCLPSNYLHTGDGGVQYVLATAGFTVGSDRAIGMRGTTDHPGLLVALIR